MTKVELINAVAENANVTKKVAGDAVTAVFAAIEGALAAGDKVQLVGFGSFEVRARAARMGRGCRRHCQAGTATRRAGADVGEGAS